MTVAKAKADLRKTMLERLQALSDAARTEASRQIVDRLAAHARVTSAARILLFANLPSEPDLSQLLDRFDAQWHLPKVRDEDSMTIHEVDSFDWLKKSAKNIREPDPGIHPDVNPSEIDLILVPGLAFSPKTRHRLGRGGGYYDRFLASSSAYHIGVCFDCQVLDEIPHEPHDQTVDEIVTTR